MEDIVINGKAIYTPKGAALEYGRVGCNFYTGCPHNCSYCVHPDTMVIDKVNAHFGSSFSFEDFWENRVFYI